MFLRSGITEYSKRPDFSLSGAAYAWATGVEFPQLKNWTSLAEGDLVRNFRLAIQLLRQLEHALILNRANYLNYPIEQQVKIIQEAIKTLQRDEVNAEKQLYLGVSL